MKKIISILISMLLISVATLPALAEEKSNLNIHDYTAAVQNEANKYGITVEILDYDREKPITEETINYGIDSVRKYAESLSIKQIDTVNNASTNEVVIMRRAMPVTRTKYANISASNIYGSANLCVEANFVIDINMGRIMQLNRISAYQYGAFINFDSWSTTSVTSNINSPSDGKISGKVNGYLTTSYTEPRSGIKTGYTSYESISYTIDGR
ncbi:hypothetical protein MOZ60_11420 [Stecheria sp. CLA-KB-P133]|uniref:Uncharacterized protein n=1 Tax=Grylomicrobium aquisgranensis TaxID=2926318 RepID=A0AB35U783_9FIRM|nr:hypothetical protein [Stecheria sp. CLA-KB-P133]